MLLYDGVLAGIGLLYLPHIERACESLSRTLEP